MSFSNLRIFSDNPSSSDFGGPSEPEKVAVSISDIVPLLIDAALTNRVWLEDFADETMEISQDLYEVLIAYRRIARTEQAA